MPGGLEAEAAKASLQIPKQLVTSCGPDGIRRSLVLVWDAIRVGLPWGLSR